MFCSNCGRENVPGASFCSACGAPLAAPPAQPPSQPAGWAMRPQTSGLAIASLVLGIGGLFILILAPLLGLVLGVVAIVQINGSRGRLRGMGLAVAGICVSALTLLLVPAILYPVFARARERARSIQCLSNIKNIATATSMYLTDYDRFWPSEHETEAVAYFNTAPGGGKPVELPDICSHATDANPYLREPVLLDEYVKNRDIWRCLSASSVKGAQLIIPMGPNGRWLQHYKDHAGDWGKVHANDSGGPCNPAFPPGWGGEVTDSLTQMRMANASSGPAGGSKVFVTGYGVNSNCRDLTLARIEDSATCVVVFESDLGCSASWGPESLVGKPRHLGGDNWGFADGHARWFPRTSDNPIIQWEPGGSR